MQEAQRITVSPRKGKEREPPQSTDFAERLVAFQRRNAQYVLPFFSSLLIQSLY